MTLASYIHRLRSIHTLSKHEQIINGVIEAIDQEFLKVGDQLPSINVMVEEVGYARKTIVNAYEELKDRGLVESKKNKGYFIISKETHQRKKVALLMYAFERFQEAFYNTLRAELGESVQIDVFFHHSNLQVFESILNNIYGKYGIYVIAPIEDPTVAEQLKRIPPEKLVIVDRNLPIGKEYNYVTQEFQHATKALMIELLPRIQAFEKVVLFYRSDRDYPEGVLEAFNQLVGEHNLNAEVQNQYEAGAVQKGSLYVFISDADMWNILLDCRNESLDIGRDIGLLSFNDHIMKDLIFDGITTISTSFTDMAKETAKRIADMGNPKAVTIPTRLVTRNSL
ncbi:MAG: GntR family transcriptional regulator [Cytophagales bacterium]|nr:GntR family transcriptional regulator [Cytophagales bacterium]